jgi:hypothetical protein
MRAILPMTAHKYMQLADDTGVFTPSCRRQQIETRPAILREAEDPGREQMLPLNPSLTIDHYRFKSLVHAILGVRAPTPETELRIPTVAWTRRR